MATLKHLSKSVSKVGGKMFERKFVTLGRLLNHWDVIVGKELAGKTAPVKLAYRKQGTQKHLTLVISTDSAQAMLLHYRKDFILEKINQLLGDTVIHALKFVDQSAGTPDKQGNRKRPIQNITLTPTQEQNLSEMLESVHDQDIRERLHSLGKSMMLDADP